MHTYVHMHARKHACARRGWRCITWRCMHVHGWLVIPQKLLQTTDSKTADNTKRADSKADELLALLEIESALGQGHGQCRVFHMLVKEHL